MTIRKPFLIRLCWLIVLFLALLQVIFNTQLQTDIASFMPAGRNDEQRQLLDEFQRGSAARLWLIAVTANADQPVNSDQIISQSQQLAQNLRQSDLFSAVLNGPAAMDDAQSQKLFSYRYLLDKSITADSFSVAELNKALLLQLEEMTSPFSSFSKRLLVSDPTAAMQRISGNLEGYQSSLETTNRVWYSSKDKRALLIASSKEQGSDIDAQEKAYYVIKTAFELSNRDLNSSLLVSGSPLFAVAARERIRQESRLLSFAAGLFMLVFMLLVFRSATAVLLTMLPLAGGLLIATALVSLLYGSIHGITLAFGITLLGVAIDYPVHLLMQAKKESSLQQAAVRIWPVLKLGVLTTALGYGAMIWTNFTGLSQLGMFSFVGLLSAAIITRTLLPLLNKQLPGQSTVPQAVSGLMMNRCGLKVAAIAIVGMIVVSFINLLNNDSFPPVGVWSHDIADLSPVPAELLRRDRMLRSIIGAPEAASMIRVEANDVEGVLQKQEQLKPILIEAIRKGYLVHSQSAADLLPSIDTQQFRQSLLPDKQTLTQRLHDALHGLPFRAEKFEPFVEAVTQTKSLLPLGPDDLRGTVAGAALQGLLSTTQEQSSKGASGVVRLTGLKEPRALEALVNEAGLPQVTFINIKAGTSELMDEFRLEMLSRVAWVAAVIMLVLLVGLRNVRQSIKVISPVVLAVMFSALVPLWLGESLNIFHLVSLLLVTGLGLDYALFFNSAANDSSDAGTIFYSLIICSTSSLIVFAMLAFSEIPVLHAIGVTVASGVVAAFVLSWWFSAPKPSGSQTVQKLK